MRTLKSQSQLPRQSSKPLPLEDERLFQRPDYDIPLIPLDLTLLDDQQLMEVFAKAVGWQNFAATVAVEMEVGEADAEQALTTVEAAVMIASWTGAKEDRVTLAKAHRDRDPQVMEAQAALGRNKAARKRAQTVRDNSERIANLVSRELTRRVGREPSERRMGRYQP